MVNVEYFSYDETNPIKALDDIRDRAIEINKTGSEVFIVAQSNGGLFGQLISQELSNPTILINPNIRPNNSILKDFLTPQQLLDYELLQNKIKFDSTISPKHILLSENDELIDPIYTSMMLEDYCTVTMMKGETHRISDNGIRIIVDSIHRLMNSYTV